jgi:putative FmdB family regulatory protein
MPSYDYECRRCGPFTEFRSIAESDETQACPQCGKPSERAFFQAPAIGGRGGNHSSRTGRLAFGKELAKWRKHSAGCGCCRGR